MNGMPHINGLTILIAGVLGILFVIGAYAVIRVLDRDDRRDPFAAYGLTVNAADAEDFTSLGPMPPEIASEPPTEIMAAPIAPPWAPAAAVEPLPLPGTLPPPPVHHDEFGPVQWYDDGPPDPAAADLPPAAPHPPPPVTALVLLAAALHARRQQAEHARAQALDTCQRATAVGAAIVAGQRARDEALAAEVEATSPWEDRPPFWDALSDDTIARGMPAIRVDGDMDAPLSIPLEVLHETDAGV